MSDKDSQVKTVVRDYPSLFAQLCGCAGPQPSLTNPRLDEHDIECPYRKEVEGDAQNLS